MTTNKQEAAAGFYGLGIAPKLLSALDALKFETPTPIQRQAIPHAAEGKDLVGIAQTGSGLGRPIVILQPYALYLRSIGGFFVRPVSASG